MKERAGGSESLSGNGKKEKGSMESKSRERYRMCPVAYQVCPVLRKRSALGQTPLFIRQGDGKSSGHNSDDDSRERANSTQNILGSSAAVATPRGTRGLRAAAGTTEGASGTGARSGRGSWVG